VQDAIKYVRALEGYGAAWDEDSTTVYLKSNG
jgi:hypothetical protein